MSARLGYVPALDGVRGIAILAVIGNHFLGLSGGFFGVDVFFVLSGFLITTLLLEEHAASGGISFRRFYERRARRLLPALGVLLLFVGLLGISVGWFVIGELASGLFYATNIVRAIGHPHTFSGPVGHLWSL